MNKHVLTGRPTADPEVSYFGKDGEQKMMAKFTLASNHMHDKDADFFRCGFSIQASKFSADEMRNRLCVYRCSSRSGTDGPDWFISNDYGFHLF